MREREEGKRSRDKREREEGREGGRDGGRDVVEGMETEKRVVREEEGEERWGEFKKERQGVTRITM